MFSRIVLIETLGRWEDKRDEVVSSADSVLTQLRELSSPSSSPSSSSTIDIPSLTKTASTKLYADLENRYDVQYGGFSKQGPKFPSPAQGLNFLSTYASSPVKSEGGEDSMKASQMATRTLRAIYEGGIRDHIGGGIARYSVDARWRVPHFEKMLYDQAQLSHAASTLASLPAELLAAPDSNTAGKGEEGEESRTMLRDLASNILVYAEEVLLDKDVGNGGGFWSAEDADSRERFEDGKGVGASLGTCYVSLPIC